MPATEIIKGLYWVGAVDWNIRYFHGPAYSTHRGTTYNAYLLVGEKIALVDTVYGPFADELIKNIKDVIDIKKIDYIIVNHVETDHSGALPAVMKEVPSAQIFCTQKAKEGLQKHYFSDWPMNVVKTGDTLSLGKFTLQFIEAPMLHWPDSMFTYVPEIETLLPNDAFGQHIASVFRFDSDIDNKVVMEEAAKYYANILSPFSGLVLKKLDEVGKLGLKIKIIAPSHGVIWRQNPGQIIDAYLHWARGEAEKKALVVYDTMWGSTEKMAKALLDGLISQGVDCKLYKVSVSDRNDIIKDLLNAKALLVGSPTINNEFLPTVGPLLDDLVGLKLKNKIGAAFGSYGWGGGSVKGIEERLSKAGISLISSDLTVKWVPTEEELKRCYDFGQQVGKMINQG